MTEPTEPTLLPSTVQRLWGVEPAAGGGRRALTLERVVAAAVAIADAEGLDAVSMKRVAAALDVTTMALYRHVDGKEQLVELMADLAARRPPDGDGEATSWRAALERCAWAMRRVLREHRWLADVPISGPPIGPNNVAWIEAGLQALRGAGLDDDERFQVVLLLSSHVRAHAVLELQLERGRARSGQDAAESERDYGRQLAVLVAADPRFPELARVVHGGLFEAPDDADAYDVDHDFRFGLDRILDGLAVFVDARGG